MKGKQFQVYKMAAPSKNDETGEICEDLICVQYNSTTNKETGEVEFIQKSPFKVPAECCGGGDGLALRRRKCSRSLKPIKCEKCSRGRHSLILLIISLTMVLPSVGVFLYLMAESLLHQYAHQSSHGGRSNRAPSFRGKLHCLFYSQFCAFCQAERSMDVIGKLQCERLEKMRKYVRIPLH